MNLTLNSIYMNIRPLGDRILVKPLAEEAATKSGILLPDTAKEKPEKGKIIAVGQGRTLENGNKSPMSVKVGDIVMFKKYSPDEIKTDGEELLLISESDVLAIIE
jgi:chaperonin GroES